MGNQYKKWNENTYNFPAKKNEEKHEMKRLFTENRASFLSINV